MPEIEVCFSPLLFSEKAVKSPYIIVVIDILRATTSICTAIEYGVKEIIPVTGLEEARRYKKAGYIVAGERNGDILDFADLGNSPISFMTGEFSGKTVVFTTTNGTVAINLSAGAKDVVIGAFSNVSALSDWLIREGKLGNNVLMLCSGWFNQFCLEDSVFAGCLSEKLLASGVFQHSSDAVYASLDLWKKSSQDLFTYMQKASHLKRLVNLARGEDLEFCFLSDTVRCVPILKGGKLVKLMNQNSI